MKVSGKLYHRCHLLMILFSDFMSRRLVHSAGLYLIGAMGLRGVCAVTALRRGGRFGRRWRWGGSFEAEEICTYASDKNIGGIKSPLDNLQIKGGNDD